MNRLSGVLAAASTGCLLLFGCDQGGQPQPAFPPPVQEIAAPTGDAAIPLGRLSRAVTPSHYLLDFTINPAAERFSGRTEIDITLTEPQRAIYLHGDTLNVTQASARLADGSTILGSYRQVHRSGVAQVAFDRDIPAGKAKLIFVYAAPFGLSLDGLYKVRDGGADYAFTQFEAISARLAFPGFDEPGFKTPFDIAVTAPAADKVIANTMPTGAAAAANGMTRTVFETTKPLPTYLVALAVGPLDIVEGATLPPNKFRDHPLHFRGITAKGKADQIKFALSLTPKIVSAYENYFGIGYPFQKLDTLAVPDFAAGAMENAGAITYRERLLLMPNNASLEQKRADLAVQAHEIAHQWFGDLVTMEWWDDTWLNESFAVWIEYKAAAAVMPQWDFSREIAHGGLQIMEVDELPSAKRIRQPINSVDDISNAFDRISYDKGAAVLGMFESYLGEDAWQAGIRSYLNKFAFANATEQDFIGTIAHETSHPEIVEAFSEFVDQPGIPLLQMQMQCAEQASVNITQSTYTPVGREPAEHHWKVPMCVAPLGGQKICKLMDATSLAVPLGGKCPSALIANVGGKGYYRFAFDQQGRAPLIENAAKLAPADQISLFFNLQAAMRAGKATAGDYFQALAKLAPKATWDLLGEIDGARPLGMVDTLHELRLNLIPQADLLAYRRLIAKLFGPRLTALGLRPRPGEKPTDALARASLVRLMVEEARDARTMAALAADARVFAASGGKNANGLPLSLVSEALRSALITQPGFGKDVITLFKRVSDENLQRAIIAAASASEDKAFLNEFLGMALTPQMRVGALTYFYQFWPREPVARDTLWAWLKANFGAVVQRASKRNMSATPGILHTACDAVSRNDLESFLGPQVGDLDGLARPLALATEEIGDCIAFKQAKSAEIAAALHRAVGK